MVRSLKAVIFDMDGVIVDSESHWKEVEPLFLGRLVPKWGPRDYRRIIGCSIQDIHALLVQDYGLAMGWPEFIAAYGAIADDIYGRRASLLEGFEALLKGLIREKLPVGLASSSPRRWIDMVVDRFGLRSSFKAIVSADDLKGEGKPSPAVYLRAARELGAAPEGCAAIEDSTNGVRSAKRAGMLCVGLSDGRGHAQDLSEADLVVRSLADLSVDGLRTLAAAGRKT